MINHYLENIQNLAKKSEKDRKDSEKEILKSHFINYIYAKAPKDIVILRDELVGLDDEIKKLDSNVKNAVDAITNYKKTFRSMLVSQSGNKRMVRILPRGNWLDQSGEVVDPAIPKFLGKLSLKTAKQIDWIWQSGWFQKIIPSPPVHLPIAYGKSFWIRIIP